jgi:hypothetical protein
MPRKEGTGKSCTSFGPFEGFRRKEYAYESMWKKCSRERRERKTTMSPKIDEMINRLKRLDTRAFSDALDRLGISRWDTTSDRAGDNKYPVFEPAHGLISAPTKPAWQGSGTVPGGST